jgi:hypothetical protein
MKGRHSSEEDLYREKVVDLSREDEDYAIEKTEDIYRTLCDYSAANHDVMAGQTVISRLLNYPLNYLLAQEELPAHLRAFDLRGYPFNDPINLGDQSPIECIDARCMGFFKSAEGREDLHRFMLLMPVETRFYVSSVVFNIQGNINNEKDRETERVLTEVCPDDYDETDRKKFEANRMLRFRAVIDKFNAIERRIAEVIDIERIKSAVLQAQTNRPCFVEYINSVNRLACIKTTDKQQQELKTHNLLQTRSDENMMLRKPCIPA